MKGRKRQNADTLVEIGTHRLLGRQPVVFPFLSYQPDVKANRFSRLVPLSQRGRSPPGDPLPLISRKTSFCCWNPSRLIQVGAVNFGFMQGTSGTPSFLGHAGGIASLLPWLPVSTVSRLNQGEGARGAGAGLTTDIGRGIGSSVGGMVARSGVPSQSALLRLALLLTGTGMGATTGHVAGRVLGEQIFQPGQRPSHMQQFRESMHLS